MIVTIYQLSIDISIHPSTHQFLNACVKMFVSHLLAGQCLVLYKAIHIPHPLLLYDSEYVHLISVIMKSTMVLMVMIVIAMIRDCDDCSNDDDCSKRIIMFTWLF